MTTALDIIKRSMRLLGVYPIGEDPSADEAATGLLALNALADSLANSGLLIYAPTLDSIALSASTGSYTIGPSGATVTARPVQILPASFITYQGVDYPLEVLTLDDYNAIPVKATSGIPGGIYALMNMPNITAYLWPVPSATMTLNLWTTKALTTFPLLTTVVSLPLGYEQMLPYLLAEILAPEYQQPVPQAVALEAARCRRTIKTTNQKTRRLGMPYGVPTGNYWTDWRY
jgi:hypothetical protein